ncbi:MAG: DUF1499 domain-containing protein [Deltaproteobacteria bacterium]|nr:DUF1499 domain-containing protein [Deltaproteobacteria bacterium]MBW2397181.1 DUF1499 domain-containing protein [Deltaproteobacteria bacterium]
MQRSKLALVAGVLGALALFDALMGPLLVHLGLVTPMFGFQWLFLLGALEGLVALVLGLIALRTTRAGSGVSGRNLAWLGIGCGALMVLVLLAAAGPSGDLPPINDITTDLEDPPAFTSDPADRDRDMAYPEDFKAQVRAAYPDLAAQATAAEPARALELAEATAKKLDWEVVAVDAATGTVLARDTTGIFQFVDDILVRVRPSEDGGSLIDVRSKSRDGRGDLGANAARIRQFLAAYPR